jgi:hypothetical protein
MALPFIQPVRAGVAIPQNFRDSLVFLFFALSRKLQLLPVAGSLCEPHLLQRSK